MTIVIGLTGSIATGKSTVSKMLSELGIPIVDADKISREVVHPGEEAYNKIKNTFGSDIILEDGSIDRKKLGAIIFTNEDKRKALNSIVHPAVRKRMLELRDKYVSEGFKSVVLDIPLLFESGLTHFVDKVLVVYVDESTQLERLMQRDQSKEDEAMQRIKAQIPIKQKIKMADALINNNGTIEETRAQVTNLLKKWDIV